MTDQRKDLIFHPDTLLGDVIKAWREVRGLTLTELAARCGDPISKGYISEVENNKIRQPNDEYLIRIAKALDIPVEYLVLRCLPDKQLKVLDTEDRASAFVFSTPIPSSQQEDDLKNELQQILDQLAELGKRVSKLMRQKGNEQ